MSNLFQKLELEAFRKGINPRTRESREWFRRRVQRLTRISREALMRESEVNKRATHSYGGMFMYFYDPKHKDKLPYYDVFPLIFPLEPAKGGFIGLNFHYLKPGARVAFLRQLSRYASDKNFDKKTRYNIGELSGTYFKKTIKHYLIVKQGSNNEKNFHIIISQSFSFKHIVYLIF